MTVSTEASASTYIENEVTIGLDNNSPLYKFKARYHAMRTDYGTKGDGTFFPLQKFSKPGTTQGGNVGEVVTYKDAENVTKVVMQRWINPNTAGGKRKIFFKLNAQASATYALESLRFDVYYKPDPEGLGGDIFDYWIAANADQAVSTISQGQTVDFAVNKTDTGFIHAVLDFSNGLPTEFSSDCYLVMSVSDRKFASTFFNRDNDFFVKVSDPVEAAGAATLKPVMLLYNVQYLSSTLTALNEMVQSKYQ